jgi:hypothetical protein
VDSNDETLDNRTLKIKKFGKLFDFELYGENFVFSLKDDRNN